jgi:hypothetical protein
MCQFDVYGLTLLSALGTVRVDSHLMNTFMTLPKLFLAKLRTLPVSITAWPALIKSVLSLTDTGESLVAFSGGVGSLPMNDLAPPPIADFASDCQIPDLLSEEKAQLIDSLILLLSQVRIEYIDGFFEGFLDVLDQLEGDLVSVDMFVSLIAILSKATHVVITDRLFATITDRRIFTPGISIFTKCANFEMIAYLRGQVLEILAAHAPSAVARLLRAIQGHAYLFADVIGRIHVRLAHFVLDSLICESLLESIAHVIGELSTLNTHGEQNLIAKTQEARSTLFIFTLAILEDQRTARRCFSWAAFANGFLSKILDPSLHGPIITIVRKFLTRFQGPDFSALGLTGDFICGIFDVCSSMSKEDDPSKLALELLSLVNESIRLCRRFRQFSSRW